MAAPGETPASGRLLENPSILFDGEPGFYALKSAQIQGVLTTVDGVLSSATLDLSIQKKPSKPAEVLSQVSCNGVASDRIWVPLFWELDDLISRKTGRSRRLLRVAQKVFKEGSDPSNQTAFFPQFVVSRLARDPEKKRERLQERVYQISKSEFELRQVMSLPGNEAVQSFIIRSVARYRLRKP